MTVELRRALPADLEPILELLRAAALPTEGVEDQFPAQYTVAVAEGFVVGVAGLELHGSVGLLRSLAVRSLFRGAGVGARLVRECTEHALGLGLGHVYLLTTGAAGYFERLGFSPTDRAAAPEALARSREFASICPTTAACLVWRA